MKQGFIVFTMIVFSAVLKAQDISSLPVVPYPAKNNDMQKALVLYISGDGGENTFSKSLMEQINSNGYPVVLFNSLKYFWTKKTPEQTAADVDKVIKYFRTQWKLKNVIIIGYSFGADVSPFVVTRFSKETLASIKDIVLMSPSKTTDFEVHVTELFGKGKRTGNNVIAEINKIPQKPLLIISGEDEDDKIEAASLKVPYKSFKLKGGHKYDSNTEEVANTIIRNLSAK